jgi:hypothetical protein
MKSTKRTPRIKPCKARGVDSRGTARMSKHPLDEVSKVQLGKGLFQSFRPIGSVKH